MAMARNPTHIFQASLFTLFPTFSDSVRRSDVRPMGTEIYAAISTSRISTSESSLDLNPCAAVVSK